MDIIAAVGIGLGAGLAAFIGALIVNMQRPPARPSYRAPAANEETQILLSNGMVVDSTGPARAMLGCTADDALSWPDLARSLRPLFGAMPPEPPTQPGTIPALNDRDTLLNLQPDGPNLRLSVTAPFIGAGERLRVLADRGELSRLRQAMALTPYPVWQTGPDRRPTWYNAAYEDICAQLDHAPDDASPFDISQVELEDTQITRTSIGNRDEGARLWFEVQSHRLAEGWLHFAVNIDAVVNSELAQRNFLQTLTRIFAHLPIGLAVFDKDRRLVLFNPALIDLTNLSAEFLSGRPNLLSFFDLMREKRMMPEPKNYQNWRDKLSELIAAASSDLYIETWNLASGLTYKITGRPHPDGGIAFLFEDISAEISLTRRFRQEIETSQAVLDCIDDAVAVFSQLGSLSFCNRAYRELWNSDPDSAFAEVTIADATALWQKTCEPSPIWSELRDFVQTLRDRAPWDAELALLSGERMVCRVEPVAGGSTLVRFSRAPGAVPHPRMIQGIRA